MLEIQPYRVIGQAVKQAVLHFIETKKSFYFHHIYSPKTPTKITISLCPTSTVKRLVLKREILIIDYLLIEIFHHYVHDSLSETRSSISEPNPVLVDSVWQHILTYFILNECSPLVFLKATDRTNSSGLLKIEDLNFWSDEQTCTTLQRFIDISVHCAGHGPERRDYAHANEYLISMLQKMATTGSLFAI